jgi:hypothetical protein
MSKKCSENFGFERVDLNGILRALDDVETPVLYV